MSRKKSGRSYRRHQPDESSGKKWLYLNIGVAVALIVVGVGSLLWMGQVKNYGVSIHEDVTQLVLLSLSAITNHH